MVVVIPFEGMPTKAEEEESGIPKRDVIKDINALHMRPVTEVDEELVPCVEILLRYGIICVDSIDGRICFRKTRKAYRMIERAN